MIRPIPIQISHVKAPDRKCLFCQIDNRPQMILLEIGDESIYADKGCMDQFIGFYDEFIKTRREDEVNLSN